MIKMDNFEVDIPITNKTSNILTKTSKLNIANSQYITNSKNQNSPSNITNPDNCKLVKLSETLIKKIFSYLERKDFIKVVLLSKKLKKQFKYKIRHLKILKFLTLYFFKTTSTLDLFNYLYDGDNYKHIQEKFKILQEKDLLKGMSLFLEYLQERLAIQNMNDNIFFIKFNSTMSLEFMSKFILIHPYKEMISTVVVEKYFSHEFFKQMTKIDKILLDEHSKNISKFFDPKTLSFHLNMLYMKYCNNIIEHFSQIKAYFFNHKKIGRASCRERV